MGQIFINEETLIGIGNAIRDKSGTTDLINTTDMASAILNLPSGGGGEWKTAEITYTFVASGGGYENRSQFDLSPYINENNKDNFFLFYYQNTSYQSNSSFGARIYSPIFYKTQQEMPLVSFTSSSSQPTSSPGQFAKYPTYHEVYLTDDYIFTVEGGSYSSVKPTGTKARLFYLE